MEESEGTFAGQSACGVWQSNVMSNMMQIMTRCVVGDRVCDLVYLLNQCDVLLKNGEKTSLSISRETFQKSFRHQNPRKDECPANPFLRPLSPVHRS